MDRDNCDDECLRSYGKRRLAIDQSRPEGVNGHDEACKDKGQNVGSEHREIPPPRNARLRRLAVP